MTVNLSIAIPVSAVYDSSDIRSKTDKLFQISRIAAIFQVNEILIYRDPYLKPDREQRERKRILRILRYIECPQYLRKRLFPITRDTSAVGILSPLATPHHKLSKDLKHNDIREAAIFLHQKHVVADVGSTELVEVEGWKKSLKDKTYRATVQVVKIEGKLKARILKKPPSNKYWGYSIHSYNTTLSKLLTNRQDFKIATSRTCEPILSMKGRFKSNKNLLLAFGGPYNGIPEILKAEGKKVSEVFDTCFTALQNYGTRSLRLEEAIMISLSRLQDII
jgi:predicted SPOUT superfamily RNA methylase MTH1